MSGGRRRRRRPPPAPRGNHCILRLRPVPSTSPGGGVRRPHARLGWRPPGGTGRRRPRPRAGERWTASSPRKPRYAPSTEADLAASPGTMTLSFSAARRSSRLSCGRSRPAVATDRLSAGIPRVCVKRRFQRTETRDVAPIYVKQRILPSGVQLKSSS